MLTSLELSTLLVTRIFFFYKHLRIKKKRTILQVILPLTSSFKCHFFNNTGKMIWNGGSNEEDNVKNGGGHKY